MYTNERSANIFLSATNQLKLEKANKRSLFDKRCWLYLSMERELFYSDLWPPQQVTFSWWKRNTLSDHSIEALEVKPQLKHSIGSEGFGHPARAHCTWPLHSPHFWKHSQFYIFFLISPINYHRNAVISELKLLFKSSWNRKPWQVIFLKLYWGNTFASTVSQRWNMKRICFYLQVA